MLLALSRTSRLVSPPCSAAAAYIGGTPRVLAAAPGMQWWERPRGISCSSAASTSANPSDTPKKVFNVRPISKDDVDISFARASGAGGQNVNKVNTKVDMRLDLARAAWIPEEVKEALRRQEKNRFTKEGVMVISSMRHRTQSQNIDDALEKLQDMIARAVEAVTPKEIDPAVTARVVANIKAGNEKRLDIKKKDSKRKSERRNKNFYD